MAYLAPIPVYVLGFITYHFWAKFRAEMNRGAGGEIERVLKLSKYSDINK